MYAIRSYYEPRSKFRFPAPLAGQFLPAPVILCKIAKNYPSMKKAITHSIKGFNSIPLWLLLFAVCMANYAGFVLYGGEEQYFAFARQFMNPDWIPNSVSLSRITSYNVCYTKLLR